MKRIYKNNDLVIKLTSKIDLAKAETVELVFYTLNKANSIKKTKADIDENDEITLEWKELSKLEQGVLYYDYSIGMNDESMTDGTFDAVSREMTNYYIVTGKADINITGGTDVNLDNYYTKQETYSIKETDHQLSKKTETKIVTQDEYNNLTDEEKSANVIYIISDAPQIDLNTKLDVETYEADKQTFALKSELPTDYVTNEALESKGYITEHQSLTDYAKTADVEQKLNQELQNIYKKDETYSKQEINDKNYLTSHQDISNKVDKEEIADMETKTHAAATYQEKGNYLTEHQSLAEYAKKSEIPTDYATKDELQGKADTSDITDMATQTWTTQQGYLTSVPSNYVTNETLDEKGYLTQHQSLEDYATKQYVDGLIGGVNDKITEINGMI